MTVSPLVRERSWGELLNGDCGSVLTMRSWGELSAKILMKTVDNPPQGTIVVDNPPQGERGRA